MDGMNHHNHGGARHGFRHMVLGCGLALLAVVFLSALDVTRGSVFVLAAVLLCPLSMLLMMRRHSTMTDSAGSLKMEDHEDHT